MKFFMIPKEERFLNMFFEVSEVAIERAKILKEIIENFDNLDAKIQKLSEIKKRKTVIHTEWLMF